MLCSVPLWDLILANFQSCNPYMILNRNDYWDLGVIRPATVNKCNSKDRELDFTIICSL